MTDQKSKQAFRPLPEVPSVWTIRPDYQADMEEMDIPGHGPDDPRPIPYPVEPFPEFQKWFPSLMGTWQTVRMDITLPTQAWLMLWEQSGEHWGIIPEIISGIVSGRREMMEWHRKQFEHLEKEERELRAWVNNYKAQRPN